MGYRLSRWPGYEYIFPASHQPVTAGDKLVVSADAQNKTPFPVLKYPGPCMDGIRFILGCRWRRGMGGCMSTSDVRGDEMRGSVEVRLR